MSVPEESRQSYPHIKTSDGEYGAFLKNIGLWTDNCTNLLQVLK